MEIKIGSEDLKRVLWITSVVFTVIGFLLALAGLAATVTVG